MRDKTYRPDSEKALQQLIIRELVARGYRHDKGGEAGYDRQRALIASDLIEFIKATQPEEYERLKLVNNGQTDAILVDRIARAIEAQGMLKSLKRGVVIAGGGLRGQATISLAIFSPSHDANTLQNERAKKNIFRVVHEVRYSPHGDLGRIDLVLFINGIPWCTIEIKTDLKQSAADGVEQYREDRKPGTGQKKEPLLTPGRGALVHLVVSDLDVRMATELKGADTAFLPLNQGDGQHAGNPSMEVTGKLGSSHLWEDLLLPASVLELIRHFIVEKKGMAGKPGATVFPRWHQRRAVRAIKQHTLEKGPGQRHLIQHSAGSGKTNTIAWLALQLQQLHWPGGERAFDSVIVVSDRNQLDQQLQAAITSLDERGGNVENIARGRGSKKDGLARALAASAPIIVVTQQSFPSLLELIEESRKGTGPTKGSKGKVTAHQAGLLGDLSKRRFAVIVDEAHGSQDGESSRKRDSALGGRMSEQGDPGDGLENFIANFGTDPRASRYPNLTLIGLTATPKAVTLRTFGTPVEGQPDTFEPFDRYTMRQAIEEGFILDVLPGYMNYNTAWQINRVTADQDILVDEREATREIIRWVEMHGDNISQKCAIILEHYHRNVAHLLNGQARAMIVTGSREAVKAYAVEMRQQIMQGKLPFKVLVAFSGKLEHAGRQITERDLNPGMTRKEVSEEFDEDGQNFLVVANKYTTGFDQPRLVAMYLDRHVSGVAAVQTLSRLNRTFPGKNRTFVLDFANKPEVIAEAFAEFMDGASVVTADDVIGIMQLRDRLVDGSIVDLRNVEALGELMESSDKPKKGHERLMALLEPARARFRERQQLARESSEREAISELDAWRDQAKKFARTYGFIDALHDLRDRSLQHLATYLEQLLPLIQDRYEPVQLPDLQLLWVNSQLQQSGLRVDAGEAKPMEHGHLGPGAREDEAPQAHVNEILDSLNAKLAGKIDSDMSSIAGFSTAALQKLGKDRKLYAQALDNSEDEFLRSPSLRRMVDRIILEVQQEQQAIADQLMDDEKIREAVARDLGQAHYWAIRQELNR